MSATLQAIAPRAVAPPGRWTVDPRHTSVEFEVRHLAIATIRGRFHDLEGALEVDDVGGVRAYGALKVESIDTGAPERDAHLLSPDFFDADRHPEIRYRLLAFRPCGGGRLRALGELTIRGVTRQTALEATVAGVMRDPWGNDRLALAMRGELSRRDFGLRWNDLLDGSPVVGDAVRLLIDLSLVRRGDPFPRPVAGP